MVVVSERHDFMTSWRGIHDFLCFSLLSSLGLWFIFLVSMA
jgi:hypothetical protein